MQSEEMLSEIRDTNLSYLILAQAMIRKDKVEALYRLGLTEPVADLIARMSTQQLVRVASRNIMICTMRFGDELVWSLLTDSHRPDGAVEETAGRLHASVLMAGQHSSAA